MLDQEEKATRTPTPTIHVSTHPAQTMTPRDWLVAAVAGALVVSAAVLTVAVGQQGAAAPAPSLSVLESL